jgi:hypothetical protein
MFGKEAVSESMKTLSLLLCAALAGAAAEAAERVVRRIAPGTVEVITPTSTNLFVRSSTNAAFVRGGTNIFFGSSTSQPLGTNVIAGRTNQLNAVGLTNRAVGPNSVLIGPVFPAPVTNLSPTGRASGFEGLGPGPAPFVTNAFGQVVTNSVTGLETPAPAVPGTPPNTVPLAPPTAPNTAQPVTPSGPPDPNAPPTLPSSPNPTPPNTRPLAPPVNPALPPTPPAPPPAAPGGTGGTP